MYERSKLSDHKFEKGKLITPMNTIVSEMVKEESWYYGRIPEYVWLGLIISDGERSVQLEKCRKLLNFLDTIDKNNNVTLPKMSSIFDMDDCEQNEFFTLLSELDVIKVLEPLSLVYSDVSEEFIKAVRGFNSTIENRIEDLNSMIDKLTDHQSYLSTDIRYLILYKANLSLDFRTPEESAINEAMLNYHKTSHDESVMQMYRSIIRSSEVALAQFGLDESGVNLDFITVFWEKISLLTECELSYIEHDKNDEIDLKEYKNNVYKILNFLTKLLKETRPLDNKMLVLLGIATYSYKRLVELADHNLENTISGRTITRSIIENYMMTKYLLKNENEKDDIWREFQDYGIGNFKLLYGRYYEENPKIENSHIDYNIIELLVSEFKMEEFIDIDTSYFGKGNIRAKFREVDEENLWKFYYDYDSNYEHGLWGAIRESSLLKCTAPGHLYHVVPDIDDLQKLPSVANDCAMIMNKHLELLKNQYNFPQNLWEGL